MHGRALLLLTLLAVAALGLLLWDDVVAPMLGTGPDDGPATLLEGEGPGAGPAAAAEDESEEPSLVASGRAREDGVRYGPDGRPLAGPLEGPGGGVAGAASVPFVGRVVDTNGNPAAGVTIVMKGAGVLEKLETGADGRFDHPARPGRYALWFDGGEDGGLVLRSWMLDGAPKDDLEFALREPATVEVLVQRGAETVGDVLVELTSPDLGDLARHEGTTGPDGRAVFEGLASGRYQLLAQVPEGPRVEHAFGAAPGKTTPVRVRVPDGVTLAGRVRAGEDGPGVAAARITLQVQARGSQGLFTTEFDTKPDGSYEVVVPQGTPRSFEVQAEGFAAWPPPKSSRGVLRSLHGLRGKGTVKRDVVLLSGAVLTGRVQTVDEIPVPGVTLRFVLGRSEAVVEARTTADGTYVAANMLPGRYTLQIATPAWFPAEGQAQRVDIPGGAEPKPTTLDLMLVGARRLHGVVLDGADQPVGGARVWVLGGGRELRSARDAGRILEAFTAADGSWTIVDLPPERNVVVRASLGDLEADPVYAPWEKPPPMPLRLTLAGTGDIVGRVIDIDTRLPVNGAAVRIVPDPFDGRNGRTVRSDARGEFTATRLLPGHYKLVPSKNDYLKAEGDRVQVARDGEVHVGLGLDPGLVFAGVVLDEAGAPLRNARLSLRGTPDGQTKEVRRGFGVDVRGRFRFSGLLPGSYRLVAWRRGYRPAVLADQRRSERELRIVLPKR